MWCNGSCVHVAVFVTPAGVSEDKVDDRSQFSGRQGSVDAGTSGTLRLGDLLPANRDGAQALPGAGGTNRLDSGGQGGPIYVGYSGKCEFMRRACSFHVVSRCVEGRLQSSVHR